MVTLKSTAKPNESVLNVEYTVPNANLTTRSVVLYVHMVNINKTAIALRSVHMDITHTTVFAINAMTPIVVYAVRKANSAINVMTITCY